MADPSGRGGYGNQPHQGYYGNQQPQQFYNMGMQQDMRQPQQPMQHQGMGGQGMTQMPQMSLQGMLQQPPMTAQQLQQNQMQHQGYSQGPPAMSQQPMQPPPQMGTQGYPQGPPLGQPQMQQPSMGNQGYSQGPPMGQQQMQGSQMGQQQMQQPSMMSQPIVSQQMQHGMSQSMQQQSGMSQNYQQQQPLMQQPQMMQPAPQMPQQQPIPQQPMQQQYGQQHIGMPQQNPPPMQQTMQQTQIQQSMHQTSLSMAGYPETQVNRPLAAVQQMDPLRPLTPTMSGSPSSVPMMRSASPMVPYPTPQSTGSPLVTNSVQSSASPMPAQQPQQQQRRVPPSAVTTTAPSTGTSTSTSSRAGGSAPQANSSSSSAQRPSGTRHSSSGNMQLHMFIKTGIYLIRHLRTEMLKRIDALEMEPEDLAANAKEVERIYMELEKLAQQNVIMPETPAKGKAFIDTAVMSEIGMNCLNNAVSCFLMEERNETAAQHHYEILRHELSNIRPITSVFKKAEVPKHNLQETHEQFENAVRNMIRDRDTQKGHNYRITLHPAGLMCSLLEVELAKRKDPVFVAQLKATIFVQYGQLVIVRLSSPFENLISDEEAIGDSKHIVFQKMSQFATEKLSGSSTSARLNSANHINAVIMFLQLFTLCFGSPCCKCKKIMHELLPPTRIADVNMSKPLFQHESCE